MARASVMLTNFTGGEQTPKLRGRIDLAKYANGCMTLQNFLVLPQGGAERRHGTEYIASAKYTNRKALLLRFEFSVTQKYILEFGHYYMRVFMNGAQVVSGASPYEIATPYAESHLSSLSFAQSADVLYIAHPSFAPRTLSRTGHTSWTLALFDWKNGPFFDQNTTSKTFTLRPVGSSSGIEGQSVYVDASSATFASSWVGRWIRIPYTSPAKTLANSTRTYSSGSWTSSAWQVNGNWVLEYRFEEDNGDGELQYSLDGGVSWEMYEPLYGASYDWTTIDGSLVASDFGGVKPQFRIYIPGNHGKFFYKFRLARTQRVGLLKITSYSSTTRVVAQVMQDATNLNRPTRLWALGAWSSATGWPAVTTFHQDRLFFASTPTQPQTVWGSKTGDYNNFEPGDDDDNALNFSLVANDVNYIRWMVSRGDLVLGGASGEWVLKSYQGPLSPTNIQVHRVSTYGSDPAGGELTDNALVYVQREGKKVRMFAYDYNSDSYQSPDMNLFADHVTDGTTITDIDYMNSPDPILWCVLANGKVGVLTLMTDQQVIAWSSFITDGYVESIATLPGEVWFYVRRTIGGSAKRYIERMTWWDGTLANASFVDSSLSRTGSPVSSVSGLSHLAGKVVSIFGDGTYLGDATVTSGGAVTLPSSASSVTVGLPYTSILVTNPLEVPNNTNTSQSYTKRIIRATIRLFKAVGGVLGYTSAKTYAIVPGSEAFTGDKEILFPHGYDKDAYVYIAQTSPLPITVTAIIAEGESMER